MVKNAQFDKADSLLKVHGILAIVFGALGVLFGSLFALLLAIGSGVVGVNTYDGLNSATLSVLTFVFFVLPHIYLIVAGIYLLRRPDPRVALTLVIINLVISFFANIVLLVFSIINLVQFADYKDGYKPLK